VFVFIGADQAKIPFEFAEAMQRLGENGRYIRITGNGKNALDFQLAYYLGQLVAQDNKAHFHIVSKDAGFDPLIKHLKDQKIQIQRKNTLAEVLVVGTSSPKTNDEKISFIVKHLADREKSLPTKTKTLANTINSLFMKQLSEAEVTALLNLLEKQKYITVSEGNVSYQLSKKTS
jgi:hypothetical protein